MATKKTVSKKTVSKKIAASAAKPRSDYSKGTRIKIARRNGEEVRSRVEYIETKATGPFIFANVGTKDRPDIKGFRPAVVKAY